MKAASRKLNRGHMLGKVLLFAIVAFVAVVATAIAAPSPSHKNGEAGARRRRRHAPSTGA